MDGIGQKFVAAVSRGKVPEGGRVLRAFPDHASLELAEARKGFESVRLLDNAPLDQDRRSGHVLIEYPDSGDGGYRAHRYEAIYSGTPDAGTASETRQFPAAGQGKAIIDGNWTSLDGPCMTCAAYVQLEGEDRLAYASLNHVDSESPERSQVIGWARGFDATALDQARGWQLRP